MGKTLEELQKIADNVNSGKVTESHQDFSDYYENQKEAQSRSSSSTTQNSQRRFVWSSVANPAGFDGGLAKVMMNTGNAPSQMYADYYQSLGYNVDTGDDAVRSLAAGVYSDQTPAVNQFLWNSAEDNPFTVRPKSKTAIVDQNTKTYYDLSKSLDKYGAEGVKNILDSAKTDFLDRKYVEYLNQYGYTPVYGQELRRELLRDHLGLASADRDGNKIYYDLGTLAKEFGSVEEAQKYVQYAAINEVNRMNAEYGTHIKYDEDVDILRNNIAAALQQLTEKYENEGNPTSEAGLQILKQAWRNDPEVLAEIDKKFSDYNQQKEWLSNLENIYENKKYETYTVKDFDNDISYLDNRIKELREDRGLPDNALGDAASVAELGAAKLADWAISLAGLNKNAGVYDTIKNREEQLGYFERERAKLQERRDALVAENFLGRLSRNTYASNIFGQIYDIDTSKNAKRSAAFAVSVLENIGGSANRSAGEYLLKDSERDQEERSKLVEQLKKMGFSDDDIQIYSDYRNALLSREITDDITKALQGGGFGTKAAAHLGARLEGSVSGITGTLDKLINGSTGATAGQVLNTYSEAVDNYFISGFEKNHNATIAKAETWLYNTFNSAEESTINRLLFGGVGSAFMGLNSAVETYNEAIEKGLDGKRAVTLAGIAGLAEWGTEQIAWGKIGLEGGDSIGKALFDAFVTEGAEESISKTITDAADYLFAGSLSDIKLMLADGMTPEQIAMKLVGENISEALAGGLSGFGSLGAKAARGYTSTGIAKQASKAAESVGDKVEKGVIGSAVRKTGNIDELLNKASTSENVTAYRQAYELKQQQAKTEDAKTALGRKISEVKEQYKAGKLYKTVSESNIKEKVNARVNEIVPAESKTDAKVLSSATEKIIEGKMLTKEEENAIRTDEGAKIVDELQNNEAWVQEIRKENREMQIDTGVQEAKVEKSMNLPVGTFNERAKLDEATKKKQTEIDKAVASGESESLVNQKYEGRMGKTAVELGGIKSVSTNGMEVIVDQKTGATAIYSDVKGKDTVRATDSEVNLVYDTAEMEIRGLLKGDTLKAFGSNLQVNTGVKMSINAANVQISMFNSNANSDAATYMALTYEAYKAGKLGMSWSDYIDRHTSADIQDAVTEEQLHQMFRAGAKDFEAKPGLTRIGTKTLSKQQADELAAIGSYFESIGRSVVVLDDLQDKNAIYSGKTGVIYLSLETEKDLLTVAAFHELFHSTVDTLGKEEGAKLVDSVLDIVRAAGYGAELDAAIEQRGEMYDDLLVREEVAAQFFGTIASMNTQTLAGQMAQDITFWNKIKDRFLEIIQGIMDRLKAFANDDKTVKLAIESARETSQKVLDVMQQALDIAERTAMKGSDNLSASDMKALENNNLSVVDNVIVSDDMASLMIEEGYQKPSDNTMFSYKTVPAWEASVKEKYGNTEDTRAYIEAVKAFTDRMVADDAVNKFVPMGSYDYSSTGPLRSNEEYVVTFDLDTSCPRTFQFVAYRNELQRRAGRPLDYTESVNLLELMRAYGQMIPCSYCYVENKRVLLAAQYNKFFSTRNAVLSAKSESEAKKQMYGYKNGGLTDASQKAFDRWMSNRSYNPSIEEVWRATSLARNSVLNYLDELYESGSITLQKQSDISKAAVSRFGVESSGATSEIKKFVSEWIYDTYAEQKHIYDTENDGEVYDVDESALELNHEALAYAKSSSSAKLVENYVPYTDQLKNIPDDVKAYIIGMGGIRKHSSNDFRIDYVQDYMMLFADLALGGWTGHTYTKNPEYAKIFGKTNDRINMSIAMYGNTADSIRQNDAEGADWAEVQKLRKAYKTVGSMAMVTSDAQLAFALNSDWIDMIIPFHASSLDKKVWYDLRNWLDYTSKQLERFYNSKEMKLSLLQKALTDAGVEFSSDEMKRELLVAAKEHGGGADSKASGRIIQKEITRLNKLAKANNVPWNNKIKTADIAALYNSTFGVKVLTGENGNRVKPHFLPGETVINGVVVPGHNNDVNRYLELCREYGVHPRFDGVAVEDVNGNTINVVDHEAYLKLVKETARTDSEQEPIQFNLNEYDEFLGMSPMDYAMKALSEFAESGGYANMQNDPYGIVDEFEKEYIGKDREIGYLTDRAKATRDIINELQNKANAPDGIAGRIESGNMVDINGEETRNSLRISSEPKVQREVYKLMRLKPDGKLYPLFIDSSSGIELGKWYDADSPSFDALKDLPAGYHLINLDTGAYIRSSAKKPSKNDVLEASDNGTRWMFIREADDKTSQRAAKQYSGDARFYYNVGINGSGSVSEFALRPGWHAGSLPVMEQIGNTSMRNIRADNFVWVRGLIPYDIDYQQEAESNPSGENDIPLHIPVDGAYIKGTSSFVTKGMAWYIAGAFKPVEIVGDREARAIIDNFNDNVRDPDAPTMNYDFPRENGRVFNANTMRLEPGNEYEVRAWERAKNATKQKTLAEDDSFPVRYSRKLITTQDRLAELGEQNEILDQSLREARKELRSLKAALAKAQMQMTETNGTIPKKGIIQNIVSKYNHEEFSGMKNSDVTEALFNVFKNLDKQEVGGSDDLINTVIDIMYKNARGAVETYESEELDMIREYTKGNKYYIGDSEFRQLSENAGGRGHLNEALKSTFGFTLMPESEAGDKDVAHWGSTGQEIADSIPYVFNGTDYADNAREGASYETAAALHQLAESGALSPITLTAYGTEEDAYNAAKVDALEMVSELLKASTIRTLADKYVDKIDELREKYLANDKKKQTEIERLRKEKSAIIGAKNDKLAATRQYYINRQHEQVVNRQNKKVRDSSIKSISKTVKWINERFTRETDDKNIPEVLKKVVAPFMQIFLDEEKTDAGSTTVFNYKQIDRLMQFYGKFSDDIDSDEIDPRVKDFIGMYDQDVYNALSNLKETLDGKRLRELTLTELDDINKVMLNLKHIIHNYNTAFVNGKRIDMAFAGESLIGDMGDTKLSIVRKLQTLPLIKRPFTTADDFLGTKMLKPIYFFKERIGGTLGRFYDDIREGQNRWYFRIEQSRQKFEDIKKKYHYKDWATEGATFNLADGTQISLDMEAMMQLYVTYQRERALGQTDHIFRGGIVLGEELAENQRKYNKKFEKVKDIEKNDNERRRGAEDFAKNNRHYLTGDDLSAIFGKLFETPDAVRYAKDVVKFLSDTVSEWGNETSMELFGIKKYTESYYFPFQSADNFLFTRFGVQAEARMKHRGFTNRIQNHANNPLVISSLTDVAASHASEMASYSTMTVPIENMQRLFNYKNDDTNVKQAISSVYGKYSLDYIKTFMEQINGGVRSDRVDALFNKASSVFKRSAVMLNLSVAIQQPSAIARAMAMVNPVYFAESTFHYGEYKELMKYSGVAGIKKLGGFDTNTGISTISYITGKQTASDWISDKTGILAEKADEITWSQIWHAVKRETAHNMGIKYHNKGMSEEFYKAAAKRFNEVVDYTQVYDSVLSKNELMRSSGGLAKMVTAFMAEPATSFNLITMSGMKKNGKTINKAAAIFSFVAATVLNEALQSVVGAWRDKDEDETYLEKYIESFVGSLTGDPAAFFLDSSLSPVTMIPWVKDMLSLIEGYDVERSDVTVASDALKVLQKAIDLLGSEDEVTTEDIKDILIDIGVAISEITPVPLKSMKKDIEGIARVIDTAKNKDFKTTVGTIMKQIRELFYVDDVAKADELYQAIIHGDKETIRRITSLTEDDILKEMEGNDFTREQAETLAQSKKDKEYDNLLKKALANNDARVQEAAQMRIDKDLYGYEGLVNEMIREGLFGRDTIVKAINDAYDNLLPEEYSAPSASKVESMYTVEEYIYALSTGAADIAENAKDDYLATAIKNGKTREKAEEAFEKKVKETSLDMYNNGELTQDQVVDSMVDAGIDKDKAGISFGWEEFQNKYPDKYEHFTSASYNSYVEKRLEAQGVPVEVFANYKEDSYGIHSIDNDGDGKTDIAAKSQKMDIINSYDISYEAKDALYYYEGWAASKIDEAPWH